MDKQGYLKTIEAVISIVAVLIFIFTILPDRSIQKTEVPPGLKNSQDFIVREILVNDTLRKCVVVNPLCESSALMTSVVEDNLPFGYNYTLKICDTTNCIAETPFDRSVYLTDVFITSTLNEQNPRIVRIWMWRA